jgi:tRNA G10  N-methylase Trm11
MTFLQRRPLKPIHPFPARMAPEIALAATAKLPTGSIVLDPMSGSENGGALCLKF